MLVTCCSTCILSFSYLQKMTLDAQSLWLHISRDHFPAKPWIPLPFFSPKFLKLSVKNGAYFLLKPDLLLRFLISGSPIAILPEAEASVFDIISGFLSLNPHQDLGPIDGWANFVFPSYCHLPKFRSCFSNQGPRILWGLHTDILGDLRVLHHKSYSFYSCPG